EQKISCLPGARSSRGANQWFQRRVSSFSGLSPSIAPRISDDPKFLIIENEREHTRTRSTRGGDRRRRARRRVGQQAADRRGRRGGSCGDALGERDSDDRYSLGGLGLDYGRCIRGRL